MLNGAGLILNPLYLPARFLHRRAGLGSRVRLRLGELHGRGVPRRLGLPQERASDLRLLGLHLPRGPADLDAFLLDGDQVLLRAAYGRVPGLLSRGVQPPLKTCSLLLDLCRLFCSPVEQTFRRGLCAAQSVASSTVLLLESGVRLLYLAP